MLLRVLLNTKSAAYGRQLATWLEGEDVLIETLAAGKTMWGPLRSGAFDLLIVDDGLLGTDLAAGIEKARGSPQAPEVVVFTEEHSPERRAEILAKGAFAVIDQGVSKEEIAAALAAIMARRTEQVRQDFRAGRAETESSLGDFASSSPAMREFLSFVRKIVDSDTTLLVVGETGVGKEYLCKAIHAESPRAAGPFVPVNCSALSETLLESELFGHVAGAFTGASRPRRGYFEMAHTGTLFLDEIGELSPQLQVKLLRVLQDKRIQPVGSENDIEIDVRLIAATNRNLHEEMDAGRFRADLYYRLSVVTLEVPPLRRRREDIPGLVESNLEEFRITFRKSVETVREDAMQLLMNYAWPGNVRELINVIERAVLLSEGTEVTPDDLPEQIRYARVGSSPGTEAPAVPVSGGGPESPERLFREARQDVVDAFERDYIEKLLARCNGRIKDSARLAGINTRSLYQKMRRLGIKKEYYQLRD